VVVLAYVRVGHEVAFTQLLAFKNKGWIVVLQLVQLVVVIEQVRHGVLQFRHESIPVVLFLPATVPAGHEDAL
jgi:hypothetical protein